jgi:hypothetical protein
MKNFFFYIDDKIITSIIFLMSKIRLPLFQTTFVVWILMILSSLMGGYFDKNYIMYVYPIISIAYMFTMINFISVFLNHEIVNPVRKAFMPMFFRLFLTLIMISAITVAALLHHWFSLITYFLLFFGTYLMACL